MAATYEVSDFWRISGAYSFLRVDIDDRKIGLSRKRVEWAEEDEAAAEAAEAESAGREGSVDLKGGIGSESGPLFKNASSDDE